MVSGCSTWELGLRRLGGDQKTMGRQESKPLLQLVIDRLISV